jgi:hypothetical protein
MLALTGKQRKAVAFVESYHARLGRWPDVNEVGASVGLRSRVLADALIAGCREKGALVGDDLSVELPPKVEPVYEAPPQEAARCRVCFAPTDHYYRCLKCGAHGCRGCARCRCQK